MPKNSDGKNSTLSTWLGVGRLFLTVTLAVIGSYAATMTKVNGKIERNRADIREVSVNIAAMKESLRSLEKGQDRILTRVDRMDEKLMEYMTTNASDRR